MIIRIALAMPFGLGIFSSLMLLPGYAGYAAAFGSYLVMMAALALKPPAALARRLGVEVAEAEPKEPKEQPDGDESLLGRLKALPLLVVAFLMGLRSKLPFIGKKSEDEDDAPAPAPAAAAPADGEAAAEPASDDADGAAAPVAVAETAKSSLFAKFAFLSKLKFWGLDDEYDEEEELEPVLLADDQSAASAGIAAEEAAPTSVVAKLLAMTMAVFRKVVQREKPVGEDLMGDDLIAAAAVAGEESAVADAAAAPVAPAEDAGPLAVPVEVTATGLVMQFPVVDPLVIPADGEQLSVVGRVLATVKGIASKVVVREAETKKPAVVGELAVGAAAPAVASESLLANLMPMVRSLASKVVVSRGDEAVPEAKPAKVAKPKRPLKETLVLLMSRVKAAPAVVIAWARGLKKVDFVPILATGWRVGGMAVFLVLALPLLMADLAVMRYQMRKAEIAEAEAAAKAPDPGEVLLDTLVEDGTPEAIAA